LLWEIYGAEALEWDHLAPVQTFRPAERRLLAQMLARGIHAPFTTSVGRLFDGIAALIGLHQRVTFEGQAAMALEFVADVDLKEAYPFVIETAPAAVSASSTPCLVLDWQPLIEAVLQDVRQGVSSSIMAARFHNSLIEHILAVAQIVGESRVALSGGCFQNRLLTERVAGRLSEAGCTVLLHRQVPPNDGGISLGQVIVATAQLADA
jgi:hydrogenase maturation protein HypF